MLRGQLRLLLRNPLRPALGVGPISLVQQAIGILRKYGTDAHVYLPGIGTVSGLTAGNYLNSAGTTAATVDNPVGLSLDALQAMTLGANIAINGGFDTDTSWTKAANWSIAGGVATSNGGTGFLQANTPPLIAGKSYEVTVTIKRYVSGTIYYPYSGYGAVPAPASAGTYTINHIAGTADLYLYSDAFNGDIDDVIVKEIPGIHATQATTANKPILRRGLVNQFLQCQDLSNAAWTSANLNVTLGQASSPYGTSDSALLAPTAVSGSHVLYQTNVTISRNVTVAFIAKAGVLQFLSPSNAGAEVLTSTFDLVSGTSVNGASTTSSMVSLGGGWWLGAMSFTAAYTSASFYINNSSSASIASFAGNGTDGLYMYSAGLFDGTYTAQQIIDAGGIPLTTSAAASSATGKYWWQFDGSNDSLSLSAPLFQMSDDHCVIAGFKADAANKYIFSQSNAGTATQCCSLRVDASGYPGAVWIDDASANALPTATTSCIGLNTVATAIKIGNAKRLRVNGVQAGATNNTALGVGTTNTYAIGCLNGSSGNFQGLISPVIAIKGTLSDSDLLVLERFVGQLSGVQI